MAVSDLADVAAKEFLKEAGDPSTTWRWTGNGFVAADTKIVDFAYPNPVPPAEITPKSLYSLAWENNTPSTEDYEEFDCSKTYTSTFTWSVKVGIKIKASETITVKIPVIGSASETTSIELSVSATVSQSTQLTDTFNAKTHIQIPPHKKLTASLMISEGKLDIPWTANVQVLLGDCGDLVTPTNGGSEYAIESWPDWEPGKVKKFPVSGTFSGVQGYGAYVKTDSTPIPN